MCDRGTGRRRHLTSFLGESNRVTCQRVIQQETRRGREKAFPSGPLSEPRRSEGKLRTRKAEGGIEGRRRVSGEA